MFHRFHHRHADARLFDHHEEAGPFGRRSRSPDDAHCSRRDRDLWGDDERPAESRGFGRRDGFGRGPFGRGGRLFENGMLKLIVLALIAEQPRHGYEVIKEIEDRTGGAYAPSAGVIYPTLTLLEETGQVETISTEGNKKLFGITEAGRKTVADNRGAIDAVLGRFAELDRAGERDPRLIRAVENLRLALRLKTRGGALDEAKTAEIARLLDETARAIDAI